jgi:catalase
LDSGKTAEWELNIQAVPEKDVATYKWNMLDPTKVVSQKDYPLIKIGKIILNRNVTNYYAESEQSAFNPGNFVPGMSPSTDRILQARMFSYPDTHRHRLGANFDQIPVNCPYKTKVSNGQRDGPMTVTDNQGMTFSIQVRTPTTNLTAKITAKTRFHSMKMRAISHISLLDWWLESNLDLLRMTLLSLGLYSGKFLAKR